MVAARTEAADWMKLGSEKSLLYHSSSHYLSVNKPNKGKPKASQRDPIFN
jgi:hypothetical protein